MAAIKESMTTFDLEKYLNGGIEMIVKGAIKASLKNPRESVFLTRFMMASNKASKIRQKEADQGTHIPPFLIASITNQCNLHCTGCYARANASCNDDASKRLMDAKQWREVFMEATQLGISFILLAGGEPLMRQDVLMEAARYDRIVFPIFTNGLMIQEDYLQLFNEHRNLVPMLSIEGYEAETDERRGEGVYQHLVDTMNAMRKKGIFYGASITVNSENVDQVTDPEFLSTLYRRGCKVVVFVEYVPVDGSEASKAMAFDEDDRAYMEDRLNTARGLFDEMVFIAFPGDEKASGGCLAAGRGFFHINATGGVEPCPFSPFSDTNLQDQGIKAALKSPLFTKLKEAEVMMTDHQGGCALFEQEALVQSLLASR